MLCFHRCLSVHRGVSAPLHGGILPLGPEADTYPGQTPPLDRHPPRKHPQQTPWADTPLGRQPPLGRYPQADTLGQTPNRQTSPAQCMIGYGQQAGGAHPTGMRSCLFLNLNNVKISTLQTCELWQRPIECSFSQYYRNIKHILISKDLGI